VLIVRSDCVAIIFAPFPALYLRKRLCQCALERCGEIDAGLRRGTGPPHNCMLMIPRNQMRIHHAQLRQTVDALESLDLNRSEKDQILDETARKLLTPNAPVDPPIGPH
jgi:hypothetical protein